MTLGSVLLWAALAAPWFFVANASCKLYLAHTRLNRLRNTAWKKYSPAMAETLIDGALEDVADLSRLLIANLVIAAVFSATAAMLIVCGPSSCSN